MKKLMIAAAIVCAAVMSQASSASWSTGAVRYDGAGSALGGATGLLVNEETTGTLFLINASDFALITAGDAQGLYGNYSNGQLTLGENTYDFVDSYNYMSGELMFMDYGNYNDGQKIYGVIISEHTTGGDVDAYAASAFVAKGTATAVSGEEGIALNWRSFDNEGNIVTGAASTWQSVPEPTSGLLLLLGVAGLALRRRRA